MLARLGLSVFFTMNVVAFTMALWTTDVYGTNQAARQPGRRFSTGCFATWSCSFRCPCFCLLGLPLFEHAWSWTAPRHLSRPTGCWPRASPLPLRSRFSRSSAVEGPVYFEVGCVILVMTTLGRWLEATGKRKANEALDALTKLLPERVRRINAGQEQIVSSAEIADRRPVAGDRPASDFPSDGRVVRSSQR